MNMMTLSLIILSVANLLTLLNPVYGQVINEIEAKECKRYDSVSPNFEEFFEVDLEDPRKNIEKDANFEVHFAIKSFKDAYILVSSGPSDSKNVPHFYIDISNGETRLYHENGSTQFLAVGRDPYSLLSDQEYRAFYIKITENSFQLRVEGTGQHVLGTRGIPIPPIYKYVSFATSKGEQASFLYDCPASGQNGSHHCKQEGTIRFLEVDVADSGGFCRICTCSLNTGWWKCENRLTKECMDPSTKEKCNFDSFDTGVGYNKCHMGCELYCDPAETDKCEQEQRNIVDPECYAGCVCRPGLYRERNGNCIPKELCRYAMKIMRSN